MNTENGMGADADLRLLVEAVGRRLDGPLAFDAGFGGAGPGPDHPLALEVEALRAGRGASLPWPTGESVAWFTLAPSHEALRWAVADLRAWVFPSLGWEDQRQPIVRPGHERGAFGARLIAISPAGYLRWYTTHEDLDRVARRLRQMRRLDARRPSHVVTARPGLFELRHRFQVALNIGDRAAAEAALGTIDAEQLDSAVNTGLMRLRLGAAFLDDAAVVDSPDLPHLLQMRLPSRVRAGVLAAYHRRRLFPLEQGGDIAGALRLYKTQLHQLLDRHVADAIATASEDGEGYVWLGRLAAYRRAAVEQVDELARESAARAPDEVVTALLNLLSPPTTPAGPAPPTLVRENLSPAGAQSSQIVYPALPPRASNPEDEVAKEAPGERPVSGQLEWRDLPGAFAHRLWPAVDAFLACAPGKPGLPGPAADEVGDALMEIVLSTEPGDEQARADRVDAVVLAAIDLCEPALCHHGYRSLYGALLNIWSERRRASSHVPDGAMMLVLAEAVLSLDGPERAKDVVDLLRSWWKRWPVRARLPWLLGALDLLSEMTAGDAHEAASSLWIDGAELIRRDGSTHPPGERALWRNIGGRLGFEEPDLTEYLGVSIPADGRENDPLRDLPAKRLAIVTLQERAARVARDMLAARTSAEIKIVVEHVANAATDAAKASDVILLAWAANKHAVTDAFADVRERIEYVSGRGASSIVAALERWALRERATPAA